MKTEITKFIKQHEAFAEEIQGHETVYIKGDFYKRLVSFLKEASKVESLQDAFAVLTEGE